MNGKSKCKILKDIRRKIAEDNEITYVTSECKYQGECTGTCPKCEAELRYLEEELAKRRKLGKTVAVAGIAAALVVGSAGCGVSSFNRTDELKGAVVPVENITDPTQISTTEPISDEVTMGDPTQPIEYDGDIPYPEEELKGEIAPVEDPT